MPFKSQAQRRLFYAKAARGEISRAKVREWERETPKGEKLPEKVAGIVPKKALAVAGALAVPYVVGKNVQKQQQQEQVVEKSAAFNIGVVDGLAKTAKEDDRPEPGFFARNMAATRAMRRGEKGVDMALANPELIGERTTRGLKGAVKGGVGGALGGAAGGALLALATKSKPGAGAGAGAVLGGLIGAHGGQAHGMYTADRDFLKKKGITMRNLGFSLDMDDEAKKKFLHKKYRGGGYKG